MRVHIFIFIFLPRSVFAQKIQYEFTVPSSSHHEAEIAVTVSGLKPGAIYFRMSRSSPGRYATHEFGKNVYNVSAVDGSGKPISVVKTDGDVYKVLAKNETVKLKYTL